MERVQLRSQQGTTAEVALHGAHVVSWRTPEGEDLLFLSGKAVFAPPKAIRGGIPICFPQFGMMGPMPSQHGFVRNVAFSVVEKEDWRVVMVLTYDDSSQPSCPHPFTLKVTTSLCDTSLVQDLEVANTGTAPLQFTAALHTYYRVSHISKVRVQGLQGVSYLDNLKALEQGLDSQKEVAFSGEFDRVYVKAPDILTITDEGRQRTFTLRKRALPDVVVWNPWVDKAKAMADFGDEEYQVMVCLEPAVAGSGPVTVEPGSSWTGQQAITYSDASQEGQ